MHTKSNIRLTAVTVAIGAPVTAAAVTFNPGEENLPVEDVVGLLCCATAAALPAAFMAGAILRNTKFVLRLQEQIGLAPTARSWIFLNQLTVALSTVPPLATFATLLF